MKTAHILIAPFVALTLAAAAAFAGDPTGSWTWTRPGRDGQTVEVTMVLTLTGGQLAGTVTGFLGRTNPISEATFHDDQIAFKVTVEFNGNTRTSSYSGQLTGDTITGTITIPARDGGEPRNLPWNATRKKT